MLFFASCLCHCAGLVVLHAEHRCWGCLKLTAVVHLCVQDADSTDIYQISRNWADLVKRARAKKLAPDEFNSGTFTISNMGMYGADTFDAILPPGK
jgi:pyruvate/2-oxoglutarate dehydrogenase complex dihydrolipoamide acyltransferase (E2) component